jgi:hypothetical protein
MNESDMDEEIKTENEDSYYYSYQYIIFIGDFAIYM